ncbi:MAG: periplasmic heavy metal sensor [Verrucomicrobiota bacterium]|nr:periplasmic heavy metal sensor [Verrucomicrobiota bacterium]
MTFAVALSLGAFAYAHPGGPRGHHRDGLDSLTKDLNLTADQQAKVQPILDAAKPKLQTIRQDAMSKAKAVLDNSVAQIRPLLTSDQQTKLDAIIKARQDMMNAAKELHAAKSE